MTLLTIQVETKAVAAAEAGHLIGCESCEDSGEGEEEESGRDQPSFIATNLTPVCRHQ
jgi:hypothetical protein